MIQIIQLTLHIIIRVIKAQTSKPYMPYALTKSHKQDKLENMKLQSQNIFLFGSDIKENNKHASFHEQRM